MYGLLLYHHVPLYLSLLLTVADRHTRPVALIILMLFIIMLVGSLMVVAYLVSNEPDYAPSI